MTDAEMDSFGDDDGDFGDDDPDFADDDPDFGDDDDEFGDDGDDGWGDAEEDDGFGIKHDEKALEKARKEKEEAEENKKLQEANWTCLECNFVNKGMGLMCLQCGKPNLGELDRQKKKDEFKEATFWSDIYCEIYPTLQLHKSSGIDLDISTAQNALRSIFAKLNVDRKIPDLKKWTKKDVQLKCQSCTSEFDEKEVQREELNCHCNICKECMRNWIRAKISDENVMPFIRCPAANKNNENCDYPIPIYVYFDENVKLKVSELYNLVSIYCEKQLARNSNWFFCDNSKKCKYGFLLKIHENEKEVECDSCGTKQKIKRKMEMDEGFKEMVKNGKIRFCPKCKFAHMKDKGLCNVLQCGACKIWWNWRTKEMADTQKALKQKARAKGTLWEPGELEYQQNLQATNLPAFIALLERNGIKYDPNYRRGQ